MVAAVVSLQPFFAWLWRATWQAGILVCLILLVQKILGRRLGVRGRYCLWLLLLLRLALPWTPHSRMSVYNLVPLSPPAGHALAASEFSSAPSAPTVSPAAPHEEARSAAGEAPSAAIAPHPGASGRPWSPAQTRVLLLGWLAGVCFLMGCILVGHVRLSRIVQRAEPVTERRVLDLLDECRTLMGTRRTFAVVVTDAVSSPALFGYLRPRLLLPRPARAELSLPELRHIFLHELAHLKRHDIALGYVLAVLHVLHWFNPLVALGLRRMRADRELVCDGLALSVLAPEETAAYGRTILHQIERLLASRAHWMLAGVSGDKTRIKQRILVISRFRKDTYRWSPLALALLVVLACAALTDRFTTGGAPACEAARDLPTTHQDQHGNIIRIHIRHRDSSKYLLADGERVTCGFDEPGDAGLWEARFDDDLGSPGDIVYFYSVAARKYLTSDEEGNLAVNGREPNETARWMVVARTDGARISPCRRPHSYLRPCSPSTAKAVYGTAPWIGWDIDQLWRVKTSDNPKSNPAWRRQHVPGPD
jgi:beta-lactamase regulating signal transducer with metallopeptidase domain